MKKILIKRLQRILIPLFIFVWWNRLHDQHPYSSDPTATYRYRVKKVKGWRTAIVEMIGGQISTITFLFKWEKY